MKEQNLFSVLNKVVLVTGASRGIGKALALGFAAAGAKVICASSREGGTEQTENEIRSAGGITTGIHADLSDFDAVEKLAKEAGDIYGDIDVLVNNGGTISRFPAAEYPLNDFTKVIDVNVNSMFLLCQIIGQKMLRKGCGKIINIASMLSYTGGMTVPAYTASKHAVAGLTKALANEWAINNIQVNAIAPGYFATDNTQALREDPERNNEIKKRIPAGKWGQPEQLVGAALFLASEASNYVNGHILAVDGGWLAR
jgi:2-dehydro-3-deoxy-D-gluconate 5-dehydrogenase